MFTVTIDRKYILASLVCAAVKDVRYYLKGVCLECADDHVKLIAVDGSRMLVSRIDVEYSGPKSTFIIPRDLFDGVKPNKRANQITIQYDPESTTITIDIDGTTRSAKAVDNRFPDWRRVVPTSVSGEPAHFNIDLLAGFQKVALILGHKHAVIGYNGATDGAVVNVGDVGVFGIVMPMRHGFVLPDTRFISN